MVDTQTKAAHDAYLKSIEDATHCHAPQCPRGYDYLKRWGFVGSPLNGKVLNGKVFCMDHQHLLLTENHHG